MIRRDKTYLTRHELEVFFIQYYYCYYYYYLLLLTLLLLLLFLFRITFIMIVVIVLTVVVTICIFVFIIVTSQVKSNVWLADAMPWSTELTRAMVKVLWQCSHLLLQADLALAQHLRLAVSQETKEHSGSHEIPDDSTSGRAAGKQKLPKAASFPAAASADVATGSDQEAVNHFLQDLVCCPLTQVSFC